MGGDAPLTAHDVRVRISALHAAVRDLRLLDLTRIWAIASDVVGAVERVTGLPGPEKMQLAEETVWSFVSHRGGLKAVRELIAREAGLGPRFVRAMVARVLVSEKNARRLIRFLIELAVRELNRFRSPSS